jgi:hypothetical protein
MTIESCVAFCKSRATPQTYVGLEYGKECFCGMKAARLGDKALDERKCYMACKGNSTELCGAGNYVNIYLYAPPAATAKPRVVRGVL